MPATDEAADSRDSTQTPAPDVVSPKGPADPTPSDTTTTSKGDLQAGAPVESAHTSNGASTAKADGAPSVDVQPEDATNAAGDTGVIFHTGIEWAHLDTTGWPPSAHKALRGLCDLRCGLADTRGVSTFGACLTGVLRSCFSTLGDG